MPSPPPAANVLSVVFGFTIGEDTSAQVKLHALWSGTTPTTAACEGIAANFDGDGATLMEPLMTADRILTSVTIQDLTSLSGASGVYTGVDTGTRAGDELPAEACLIMNHRIARRYRGGKPRSYFPWGAESDLANAQTWTVPFLDDVETGWATFLTNTAGRAAVDGTKVGVLVSLGLHAGFTAVTNPITGRTRDVPKYSAAASIDPITLSQPNSKIGSQRRRQLHSS